MSLTSTDIARIANLARLELEPAESERMLTQMNDFFAVVEQMRAVDTTGLEPLAHPVAAVMDVALRLREDVVSEPNRREANQQSAPAVEHGLFLVPKVIE
jgi:aspartyl-tRNA(Asn)/glutamyl-tRNA(Gln) amidotransferase subunit C